LTAYSTQRDAFTENHQRILEAIAGQVGQALKDSIVFDQKEQERLQRQISGLPDFKQVEGIVAAELNSQSSRTGLSILHVDIRQANRASALTDAGISAVLDAVRRGLRDVDMLFRSGDHSLLALLPATDRETALDVSATIRENLDTIAPSHNIAGNVILGAASAPSDGMTLNALIDAARRRATTPISGNRPPSVH
jgi:GGDEF domain-containing protein